MAEGTKYDAGKARWDLIPPSIQHVVDVFTIGSKKYDDHNWAKGMAWCRIFGAMMRHSWAWFWGEETDPQDGQRHLASVVWCALVLMQYTDSGLGTDDRHFRPHDGGTQNDPSRTGISEPMEQPGCMDTEGEEEEYLSFEDIWYLATQIR